MVRFQLKLGPDKKRRYLRLRKTAASRAALTLAVIGNLKTRDICSGEAEQESTLFWLPVCRIFRPRIRFGGARGTIKRWRQAVVHCAALLSTQIGGSRAKNRGRRPQDSGLKSVIRVSRFVEFWNYPRMSDSNRWSGTPIFGKWTHRNETDFIGHFCE